MTDDSTDYSHLLGVRSQREEDTQTLYLAGELDGHEVEHLPHAVGLAWAARIKEDRAASLVWFGDGATSEGDFHEAMNFASVLRVATVFFCVNNQWAISTPIT
jgi:transketolase N-terminal domain/subunit